MQAQSVGFHLRACGNGAPNGSAHHGEHKPRQHNAFYGVQSAALLIVESSEMNTHKKSAFTFAYAESIGGNFWLYAIFDNYISTKLTLLPFDLITRSKSSKLIQRVEVFLFG